MANQNDSLYRLLVESVVDYAIFLLNAHGNVASWNEGAQRINGYLPEEIIGRHFSTFYTAEDKARHKPEWELETAIREGRVEDEAWRVRKDGSLLWANVVITASDGQGHTGSSNAFDLVGGPDPEFEAGDRRIGLAAHHRRFGDLGQEFLVALRAAQLVDQ